MAVKFKLEKRGRIIVRIEMQRLHGRKSVDARDSYSKSMTVSAVSIRMSVTTRPSAPSKTRIRMVAYHLKALIFLKATPTVSGCHPFMNKLKPVRMSSCVSADITMAINCVALTAGITLAGIPRGFPVLRLFCSSFSVNSK